MYGMLLGASIAALGLFILLDKPFPGAFIVGANGLLAGSFAIIVGLFDLVSCN